MNHMMMMKTTIMNNNDDNDDDDEDDYDAITLLARLSGLCSLPGRTQKIWDNKDLQSFPEISNSLSPRGSIHRSPDCHDDSPFRGRSSYK